MSTPSGDGRRGTESKAAFETYIREYRRPDIGDDADTLTEADFICDLAEDGWTDCSAWLDIWVRLHEGGELTPREREQALAYWAAGEDAPPDEYRLAPVPREDAEEREPDKKQ